MADNNPQLQSAIRFQEAYMEQEKFHKKKVRTIRSMLLVLFLALWELCTRLNMIDDPRRGPDRAAIMKIMPALSYINENYPQPLTLDDVCRYMGLNCAYFCRLFRTSTGITFTEYLNALRVRKSAEMLSGSSKSVTEISMDVGFSTVAYYNRVFKKYMRCTPTVYRFLKYKNM